MTTRSAITGPLIALTLIATPIAPAFSGDRDRPLPADWSPVAESVADAPAVPETERETPTASVRLRGALVLLYLGLASKCSKGACPVAAAGPKP